MDRITPIVLTGDCRGKWNLDRLKKLGWGRLSVVAKPDPYPGEPWGIDNGAYSAYLKGEPLNIDRFHKRCDEAVELGTAMMAVLPDKVAAGVESLDYSMDFLEKLPELPRYLAVQDGMEYQPGWGQTVEALKDPRIKGIFLGGTSPFKIRIDTWKHTATMLDKKLHYGRAGTPQKVDHAIRSGVDSLDSAFPLWTKERWKIFELAVAGKVPQMTFEDWREGFFEGKNDSL